MQDSDKLPFPIPEDWRCTITSDLMFDPVLVHVSGHSYEREALEEWLKKNNTDPNSKQLIPPNGYSSNQSLQKTIFAFAKQSSSLWTNSDGIYRSTSYRDKVWKAAEEGNETEFSRLLELDPRVIYELRDNKTLLEFLSEDEKRISCIKRVVGQAKNNPLGGYAKLKEVTTDVTQLFFNLAKIFAKEKVVIDKKLLGRPSSLFAPIDNTPKEKPKSLETIRLLLEIYGWNFERALKEYYFKACDRGFAEILSIFTELNEKFKLNSRDSMGNNALYHALVNNQFDVFQWLLTNIPIVDLPALLTEKLVFSLIQEKEKKAFLEILKKEFYSEKGYHLFAYLVINMPEQIDIFEKLLGWGIDFYQNAAKWVLENIVGLKEEDISAVLENCLKRGADVNYVYQVNSLFGGEIKITLLHLSAKRKSILPLQIVCASVKSINQQNNEHKTVSHLVVSEGKIPHLQFLLTQSEIDWWAQDIYKKIPLEYSFDYIDELHKSTNESDSIFSFSSGFNKIRLASLASERPAIRKEQLKMLASVYKPPLRLFRYLLEKYFIPQNDNPIKTHLPDIFAELGWNKDFYQRYAFEFASKNEPQLLNACLDLGVSPNAVSQEEAFKGQYLLATAMSGGIECVKVLLDKKADITLKIPPNDTFLHEAIRRKQKTIVFELMERGLDVVRSKTAFSFGQPIPVDEYAETLKDFELANAIRQKRRELKFKPFIEPLRQENESLKKRIAAIEQKAEELESENIGLLVEAEGLKKQKQKLSALFQLYKAEKKLPLRTVSIGEHKNSIFILLLFKDTYLLSGAMDCRINVWDIEQNELIASLDDHGSSIFDLISIQNGKYFASAGGDKIIRLWSLDDPENITAIAALKGHENCVDALAEISNKHIVSGSRDKTIKIWDIEKPSVGKCIATISTECSVVALIKLPHKEKSCLFAANIGKYGNDVGIYDATDPVSPKLITTLKGHDQMICDFSLSPQGYLISASHDKTIKIWDVSDLNYTRLVGTLYGHTEQVTCIQMAPNGNLVSVSKDKTVRIWDLQNRNCIKTLENDKPLYALAVLPEGDIVTGETVIEKDKKTEEKAEIDKEKKECKLKLWSRANYVSAETIIEQVESAIPECNQM